LLIQDLKPKFHSLDDVKKRNGETRVQKKSTFSLSSLFSLLLTSLSPTMSSRVKIRRKVATNKPKYTEEVVDSDSTGLSSEEEQDQEIREFIPSFSLSSTLD